MFALRFRSDNMKLNLLNSSLLDCGSQTPHEGKEVFYFMAINKKSFIAYSDWYGMFNALPNEVAGELIKHIFAYVNDENPTSDNFIINALFEQVKATLKRDLVKWEDQREQRSLAGKKSAENRLTKSNERSNSFNETERKSTVSVSVSDSVSVNDNVKKINIPFLTFWNLYDKKIEKDKCESKWNKLTNKDREDIINHIPKYKLATPDKQYRKNPETYFNNKTWRDEIIIPHSQTQNQTNINLPQNKRL